MTAGTRERLANLRRGVAKLDERADAERAARNAEFTAAMRGQWKDGPMTLERGFEGPRTATRTPSPAIRNRQRITEHEYPDDRAARTAALRTIEEHRNLDAAAADRLDEVIRRPEAGAEARYIAAVGDPMYMGAFLKILKHDAAAAKLYMTAEEEAAWDAVSAAGAERASLSLSTGGVALPMDLDPTLVNISSGANCPLRKLARVQVLTQNTKHFVNSTAVTSTYQAEAATWVDASPTLTGPVLTAARGGAAITASFEILQDDPGIVNDLVRLIADGRDTVDATAMLTGSGTNTILGVLTVGTTGALTTGQRIQSATADVVAPVDVHSVYNAIPPRFQENTQWVSSPGTYSVLYNLVGKGSTTLMPVVPDFGANEILGKPWHPWSTMTTLLASGEQTGNKVLIGGDWANAVTIGDRLGMTIEQIPNFLDATTGYPTGQRILFGWWRTGVVVHNVNALRYLELS
jgi:HK97 family phage major capsid protein